MIIRGIIPGQGPRRITVEGGNIAAVETWEMEAEAEPPWIWPGLIDLQINGYGGINFSAPDLDRDALIKILPLLWGEGVTQILPTLITNEVEIFRRNFQVLEATRRENERFRNTVPGYHLEGPFLSQGPSQGAHQPNWMRNPDWSLFSELQEAAGGNIRILTLAPELPGAEKFIEQAADSGVIVALSHTDAEPEIIQRAVQAGATMNTHLGNGCPQSIDRHHSPLWAQLANPDLSSGLICDGHHLIPDFVRLVLAVKPAGKVFLVSDAVHLAGLPPGDYDLSGKTITLLESGKIITGNQGSLAGASLPLRENVRLLQEMTGVPLAQALSLASTVPAEILDTPGLCRKLVPGQPAHLIQFREKKGSLIPEQTLLSGEIVYSN